MTEMVIDNLREDNLNPGAGDTPPDGADTQAAAGMDQEGGGGTEKLPWHEDPRFKEFLESKKELDDRLAKMREQDVAERERQEIEGVGNDFPVPEEMPMPSTEDFEAADFTDTQADVVRRLVEAAVHNDRRKMALSYTVAQKRQREQKILADRKRREVLLEAEKDFGNKEFGSLADPSSQLRQRAEVILRANNQYQSSPIGIYRACKDAYNELASARGRRGGTGGEEMISGRQPGGATLPGPRPGFKRVSEDTYNAWPREKQEAYDRASLGLPPEK